ncbi:UNVERIFIED_CONTAM: hypothetical protein PYX00_008308 [Menopon gallinae]|uniref:CREG-like beta-barrel domain-containing protein n=1 Tax=Menopon gallinae TaxID=328185 RepID=A0AAW2HNJ6_9NEOP
MRPFIVIALIASVVALASCEEETFAGIPITQLPEPGNEPAMARYIVNNANWTAYGYVSTKCGSPAGCPANAVFATSDGKVGCGNGTPYFWASRHHPSVVELLDKDPRGALAFTLAQTNVCKERGWDPQDPRCAHIIVYGNFTALNEKDPEYNTAKQALLTRHPQFSYYPPGHQFFYAKYKITSISIINKFGGPTNVDVNKYYQVKC